MQAAIGLAQMEKLDEILALRKKQMNYYYKELSEVDGITLRKYANWCDSVHWMMTITLDEKFIRNKFLSYMEDSGIDCRQMINPVHRAEHFVNQFDDEYPVSKDISRQSVHLPSSLNINKEDIRKISNKVRSFLNRR
jgi:perosamine synthetase